MKRKMQYSLRLKSRIRLGETFLSSSSGPIVFPISPLKPLLTILLVHRNGLKYLEETLRSIHEQTFVNYEILVVDGLSTDGSLDYLKSIKNIRLYSSQDNGFTDAFQKGVALAQGKYITHCCVSDGYLSNLWFEKAVGSLEKNPFASLVWGFPRTLDENGLLQEVSYPDLHWIPELSGVEQQLYLIRNTQHFPEGNFIVRTSVMRDILNSMPIESKRHEKLSFDIFLEFSYQFIKGQYISIFLPIVANFGRIHSGSLTEVDENSHKIPVLKSRYSSQRNYLKKQYLESTGVVSFVNPEGYEHFVLHSNKLKRKFITLDFQIRFLALLRKGVNLIASGICKFTILIRRKT